MEAQIESAIARGLTAMCFTEHYDKNFPYENDPGLKPEEWGMFELDMAAYRKEFLEMRERYGSRIQLYFGVELGLQPDLGPDYEAFLSTHSELDFVIGSTHICDGTDPYYPVFYEGKDEAACYRHYFEYELANLTAMKCYDTCGHMDYIVRYGPTQDRNYSYGQYAELFDAMLEILIRNDKALEVNTAPLTKGCRDLNPSFDILKRYHELGGRLVTIGSDAHTPDRIAENFAIAQERLRSAGFTSWYTYDGRQPVEHAL